MAPTVPSRSTRGRSQRVPPAITTGSESMPALHVVEEIPGDLGVVLWRSVRNVALWARTEPENRGALFDPAAAGIRAQDAVRIAPEPELVAPLSVVVSLLEAPERVDVARLVHACRRVAAWAEARGALGTALEFAQAAALAQPDAALLAFDVGRLARRRAEYDRAESWYVRAIVQGRQTGDWRSYSRAFSGLGNLSIQRGNYLKASRAHQRCLRAAVRHSLRDLQGESYHALFTIKIESGVGGDPDDLAANAFRSYGANHPKLPRLAYDIAYQWALRGLFAGALPLAEALLPHFEAPAERALVLGLVARTAGGAGQNASFEDSVAQLRRLYERESAIDTAASANLGVAYGAGSLSRWDVAAEFASAAVQFAAARREGRVLLEAEAALDSVTQRARTRNSTSNQATPVWAEQLLTALQQPARPALA